MIELNGRTETGVHWAARIDGVSLTLRFMGTFANLSIHPEVAHDEQAVTKIVERTIAEHLKATGLTPIVRTN